MPYQNGSSPRVRGTSASNGNPGWFNRFIPARAGNILLFKVLSLLATVHPRACGEHPKTDVATSPAAGSSPRVRGTSLVNGLDITTNRFIPARAGNIPGRRSIWQPASVHPRACGEHCFQRQCVWRCAGSSPRVRGTWRATCTRIEGIRFIPARAGNIPSGQTPQPIQSVHPRACGEHLVLSGSAVSAGGSSPRVRGTYRFSSEW